MMRYVFIILLILHGMLHLLGFFKAFQIGDVSQLKADISKPVGLLWLVTAALFIITAFLFLMGNKWWWLWSLIALVLSQVIVLFAWQDAKYGTILNMLILVVTVVGYGGWQFERTFQQDVAVSLDRSRPLETGTLTEKDLERLPEPVKRYLRYVGAVGKPKVKNFKVVFEGEMRNKGQDWFPFTSKQYNFMDRPERFFFMEATIKGLPTDGYHLYHGEEAGMKIKLLSLLPVVDMANADLFRAETVTVFNDMCLMAPATLIDERIEWESIDSVSAKAIFTNQPARITAELRFNEEGQLINFISDDRGALTDGELKNYRFTTPVGDYKDFNGYNLPSYGEAVWHYPEEEFVYGKFNFKSVEYNVTEYED